MGSGTGTYGLKVIAVPPDTTSAVTVGSAVETTTIELDAGAPSARRALMSAVYLDSSAIVKLAVLEPESSALRRYLRGRRPWVSSSLARTEVLRAVLPRGEEAAAAGRAVLARCDLVRVSDHVLTRAGILAPHELRSLYEIHSATGERLVRAVTWATGWNPSRNSYSPRLHGVRSARLRAVARACDIMTSLRGCPR